MSLHLCKSLCSKVLLISSIFVTAAERPCAHFEFPTLIGNKLITLINNTVDVPFKVNVQKCTFTKIRDTTISIHGNNDAKELQCMFIHPDGECVSGRDDSCVCPTYDSDLYHFKLFTATSNNGTWTWSTLPAIVQKDSVDILVVEPPKITGIELKADNTSIATLTAVPVGSSVEIVCSWDNGGDPVQRSVPFVTRDGKEIDGLIHTKTTSSSVHYEISSIQCEDAGAMTCILESTPETKNTTLLVHCPPDIDAVGNASNFVCGNTCILEFSGRMYTPNITSCHLTKRSSGPTSTSVDCMSLSHMSGTPPDLTLTITLTTVTQQTGGTWRLILSNEAGNGSVVFNIYIPNVVVDVTTSQNKVTVSNDEPHEDRSFAETPQFEFLQLGIIAVVLVLLIIFGIVFLFKKRVGVPTVPLPQNVRQEAETMAMVVRPLPLAVRENRDSVISQISNIYEDIPDNNGIKSDGSSSSSDFSFTSSSDNAWGGDGYSTSSPSLQASVDVNMTATTTEPHCQNSTLQGDSPNVSCLPTAHSEDYYLHPICSPTDISENRDQSLYEDCSSRPVCIPVSGQETSPRPGPCEDDDGYLRPNRTATDGQQKQESQAYDDDGYISHDPICSPIVAARRDDHVYENTKPQNNDTVAENCGKKNY